MAGERPRSKGKAHSSAFLSQKSDVTAENSDLVERVHPQSFHNQGEAADGLAFAIADMYCTSKSNKYSH